MSILRLSLFVATLFAATPATASSWYYASGNDDIIVFVDSESSREISDRVQVWTWTFYRQPHSEGWQSSKTLDRYDCKQGTSQTLQITAYFHDGSNETERGSTSMVYVTPETIEWGTYEFVCGQRSGAAVEDPEQAAKLLFDG